MQIDNESLHYLWTLVVVPITWLVRLVWVNHKSLQDIREELAKQYATKLDLDRCSDDKDRRLDDIIEPLKEGHKRIENKLDQIIERELKK